MTVAQLCRDHNVSQATFYKWKVKFGGMNVSEAKRLRQLEDENAKFKRIMADLNLDLVAVKGLLKKLVTPAAQKVAVQLLQKEHGYSQRRACRLTRCQRTTARRFSKRQENPGLRERLRELAGQKKS